MSKSKEEKLCKALRYVTFPIEEITLWPSYLQNRCLSILLVNPTKVTVGYLLKASRRFRIEISPRCGFIQPQSYQKIDIVFWKLNNQSFKIRNDRLTAMFAVKPDNIDTSDASILWDESVYFAPAVARRCIKITYQQPFEGSERFTESNSSLLDKKASGESVITEPEITTTEADTEIKAFKNTVCEDRVWLLATDRHEPSSQGTPVASDPLGQRIKAPRNKPLIYGKAASWGIVSKTVRRSDYTDPPQCPPAAKFFAHPIGAVKTSRS
ncbi:hypothetical protein T4A_3806 [Trichinella pseudospiralis]|uniref:Major sperm protein n=1 Tax=Trichinella pseudospiralis TaxID=6337 RepID=A0A0V1EJJ5_TRIPS|nr:hypothetical protein T4A_3806 [Trichinella pseudospiralis]